MTTHNDENTFRINEIFYSIQGEGPLAGYPCVFIRMQGCNLRCNWCDTKYAIEKNFPAIEMTSDEIFQRVSSYGCNNIEFTGGEPLLQKGSAELINSFDDKGFITAVETNGSKSIAELKCSVLKILDIKCPDSGMDKNNDFKNIDYLNTSDCVKFVIASYSDYLWAKEIVEHYNLQQLTKVYFSPAYSIIDAKELALWILKDRLDVKLQLQLHKCIWDARIQGV